MLWLVVEGGVGVGLAELSGETSSSVSDENRSPFDLRTGDREGEYVPDDVTEGTAFTFHFLFCFSLSFSLITAAF